MIKPLDGTCIRTAAAVLLSFALALFVSFGCGGSNKPASTGTNPPTGTGKPTGNVVPRDMKWVVKPLASDSWLESKADLIKTEFARGVWKATEGQMFLRNQTLRNNCSSGDVVFMNLDEDKLASGALGMCRGYGSEWWIELPGICAADNFLHEFCHGGFTKLHEEYDCDICTMGAWEGRSKVHYCDKQDCVTPGIPGAFCWENFILKKYTDWTHTNRDPGSHPDCTVTIEK